MQNLDLLPTPNERTTIEDIKFEIDGKSIFPSHVKVLEFHSDFKKIKNSDSEYWCFPPLYDEKKNGWQVWQVMFIPEKSCIYRIYGFQNKKLQILTKVIQEKSNRNIYQQGALDCVSEMNSKMKSGKKMFSDLYIDSNVSSTSYDTLTMDKEFNPMSALDYNKVKNIVFPCDLQDKFDGFRGYSSKLKHEIKGVGSCISIKTRNKHLEMYHLQHVRKELEVLFNKLKEGIILDGEIYHHGTSFQTIASMIKNRDKKHELNDQLKYYVFDLYDPENPKMTWLERKEMLNYIFKDEKFESIILSRTKEVNNEEEIEQCISESLEDGYEGIMLRAHAGIYKNSKNRSKDILKYKRFYDEEAICVDILSGNGSNKNAAILVLEKEHKGDMIRFKLTPAVSIAERKRWFKNKDQYIGKHFNYVYQELSLDGIPRFANRKGGKNFIDKL